MAMMAGRYSRQELFAGIGVEGQAKLNRSRALLVGCGALGSVIAEILVRAGIGSLAIADRDYLEESNLQRQSLFTERDWREGLPKAVAAVRHLREINGSVDLTDHVSDVDSANIEQLLVDRDFILDGTDNFETRYLLNDASWKCNVPWIYGACVGSYGLCFAFVPGRTPCLRCLLGKMPPPGCSPTCDTAGVIGSIVHLVAAFEAAEALKIATGNMDRLNSRLLTFDMWENRIAGLELAQLPPEPQCPTCALHRYEHLSGGLNARLQILCGSNAVQLRPGQPGTVDFAALAKRLSSQARVTYNDFLLKAAIDELEIALFKDGRAILRGVRDLEKAKQLYARYIGT